MHTWIEHDEAMILSMSLFAIFCNLANHNRFTIKALLMFQVFFFSNGPFSFATWIVQHVSRNWECQSLVQWPWHALALHKERDTKKRTPKFQNRSIRNCPALVCLVWSHTDVRFAFDYWTKETRFRSTVFRVLQCYIWKLIKGLSLSSTNFQIFIVPNSWCCHSVQWFDSQKFQYSSSNKFGLRFLSVSALIHHFNRTKSPFISPR